MVAHVPGVRLSYGEQAGFGRALQERPGASAGSRTRPTTVARFETGARVEGPSRRCELAVVDSAGDVGDLDQLGRELASLAGSQLQSREDAEVVVVLDEQSD